MEMPQMIVIIIVAFIGLIAVLTPYVELGNKTHFLDYNESVSDRITTYNTKLTQLDENAQQHLNETKQIKPLFTSITESFDRLGSLVQSSFDSVSKTTDMIDESKQLISDGSQKANIPAYFIVGFLAIITIIVVFLLIKFIIGR